MKTLIAAALLLALTTSGHAAPEGEWFLILDAWSLALEKSTEDRPPYDEYVTSRTYATRKECLAQGHSLAKMDRKYDPNAEGRIWALNTLDDMYNTVEKAVGMPVGGFHPRCEWHR